MSESISNKQMYHIVETICDTIEEQQQYLSDLDGELGDGDHGVNMAKCFREVRKKVEPVADKDCGTILKTVGMYVMNSVGGAMGALYGTMFLKLAAECTGKTEVTLDDLARMFTAAENGIRTIGKAQVGDKTLLDTVAPAVASLQKSAAEHKSLTEALAAFEMAAKNGMESTRDLIAKMGRASRLGERTIGHLDAGATSCYFILRSFAHGVEK
ncbi:dihydroxyacetone kinase DhaL subunit [Leptolinea tardivitalis]|nr:dihydroxyacetone kinase DhaL subunit [Leptolinea tardivitalis]